MISIRLPVPKLAFNVLLVDEGNDEGWSALCLELEGCMTQGDSERDALENIFDAIKLNIEWLRSEGKPIPSAAVDHVNGDMVIPDFIPTEVHTMYPHLDQQMFHSANKKTILVS